MVEVINYSTYSGDFMLAAVWWLLLDLYHTEIDRSNFKSLPHRELSKRVSEIKCIFVTQNMQDVERRIYIGIYSRKGSSKRKLV